MVFGVLGVFACLAEVAGDFVSITRLTADFFRPMFIGTEYTVDRTDQADTRVVRLLDGSTPLLAVTITTGAERTCVRPTPVSDYSPHFERSEARTADGDIEPGFTVSGDYTCDGAALDRLRCRWKTSADPFILELLLWSSYFVGMELPGRSALFFRLSLSLENAAVEHAPLRHLVRVIGFDRTLRQMRAKFSIQAAGNQVASGEYRAFVRPDLIEDSEDIPAGSGLVGKTVCIIGASRGLGATLRRLLEAQGAKVLGLSRGQHALADGVISGDASDPSVLARARERITEEFGSLDFLICNACPSILPLRLEQTKVQRIDSYISSAVALVAQPLTAFLDLLEASGGCNVVISSIAVENPVREWPHYVAAKKAVEGLAQVATLQFPKTSLLIVRPEKLLTEMTNTPMGRRGAISPTTFARKIVERMQQPLQAGVTEILR